MKHRTPPRHKHGRTKKFFHNDTRGFLLGLPQHENGWLKEWRAATRERSQERMRREARA